MGGGGFDPIDPINNPMNRWIRWGLEPAPNVAQLGPVEEDVGFKYRLATFPSIFRYTFSNGSAAVDALAISNVVAALRWTMIGPPVNADYVSLVVNLEHWSSNRSEQHFPWMQFDLLNAAGTRLTILKFETAETFVSACQNTVRPGAAWQSEPKLMSGAVGPVKAYFDKAASIRLVLPEGFGGTPYDHGTICH